MTRSVKCAVLISIAFGAWTQAQAAGATEPYRGSAREEVQFTFSAEQPFDVPDETSPMFTVLPGATLVLAREPLSLMLEA